jgi:predicted acyl esterase
MSFTFDEHAFVIKKGEKLRIDVSSSAFPHYVPHTNNRGPFALQTTAKIAHNTVICDKSSITLLLGE